jgi:dCMP deaminase
MAFKTFEQQLLDRERWDRRFLALAEHVAQWSKDPSTKVGAIVVEPSTKLVLGLGYNGFARGVEDTDERLNDRETKYRLVVHAEVNAILAAGLRARGATIYVWPSFMSPPICSDCGKMAIQAGIQEIVGYEVDETNLSDRQLRWKDSIMASRQMWDEAGLRRRGIRP